MYNTTPNNLVGWNKKQKEKLKTLLFEAKRNKEKTIQFNHWIFNTSDVEHFLNDLH